MLDLTVNEHILEEVREGNWNGNPVRLFFSGEISRELRLNDYQATHASTGDNSTSGKFSTVIQFDGAPLVLSSFLLFVVLRVLQLRQNLSRMSWGVMMVRMHGGFSLGSLFARVAWENLLVMLSQVVLLVFIKCWLCVAHIGIWRKTKEKKKSVW